jgi:hypothetical protein
MLFSNSAYYNMLTTHFHLSLPCPLIKKSEDRGVISGSFIDKSCATPASEWPARITIQLAGCTDTRAVSLCAKIFYHLYWHKIIFQNGG